MQIVNPTYYSGIGKRKTNEDFVFPENPASTHNLFMVCDGMGGMAFGELASKLTGLAINQYLDSKQKIEPETINNAILYAHQSIHKFSEHHPNTKGMGSTVALLAKNRNSFYAAWVGDSRIYQIRKGEIIFQSKDHSYNQWLADKGIHGDHLPNKNIITQAIGGNNVIDPSIAYIENVDVEDYFILVTDGILEGVKEYDLKKLFDGSKKNDEILTEIVKLCSLNANDNHSVYILKTTNN